MPRKRKFNTDHCVIRNGQPFCEHCGASFEWKLPMPVGDMVKLTNAFANLHKYCTEKTWTQPVAEEGLNENEQAMFWLANGERGISSETMFSVLASTDLPTIDLGNWGKRAPSDPDDFRRCHLLLEAIPSWRSRLDELKVLGDPWPALVDNWDNLTEMLIEQKAGEINDMYGFMKELGC